MTTQRPLYLGIDLGTTNSAAAVFDGDKLDLVRTAAGATLTPSVVRIDGRGIVTVGQRARRFLDPDPANTRAEFKRLMGTAARLEFAATRQNRAPEELAAEVLRSLRADASDQLGFLPERAVISVPALFELPQSAATSEAARLAGFERVDLIQEPVASALAAGWTADDASLTWLVYDLGGGTFDASLLETRDGLLRVVGHDGDNFLGGRDIDLAIVDWVIAELERTAGVRVDRGRPEHQAIVRKLKNAAEEAKHELGRVRESPIVVGGLEVDGRAIDVDLVLNRATLDAVTLPLVERSIAVCRRLIAAHGLSPAQIGRVVLVGGPTVMPVLRERVKAALGAPFGEGLDPMTLVAQGAALYAATAGLDARPRAPARPSARRVWLQYPAMSSDLTPHVVGRFVDGVGPRPATVRLHREDGLHRSEAAPLDEDGAFVLLLELLPRRPNTFRIEARAEDGSEIAVEPPSFTIVQGLTIADPPLSRTIGVALANDVVRVYFERGTPLPARRTFVHHAVETVARGTGECVLRIPIVQGEFEQAHLCRLVGTLEIGGGVVSASLAAGSKVELTLELDRGGRLSARALVPTLGQVFEQVAQLLVPDATPDTLDKGLAALRDRLADLRAAAFRRGNRATVERLATVERSLGEVAQDIRAARGGDADAGQKARRTLIEIDGLLEEVEFEGRWPELEDKAREDMAHAASWVAEHGSPQEQKLLGEACAAVEKARAARNAADLQRHLRVIRNLANAAYFRDPNAWEYSFENVASNASQAIDLPRAEVLVRDGRKAIERGDRERLKAVVEELWRLIPGSAERRHLGYDSGVR